MIFETLRRLSKNMSFCATRMHTMEVGFDVLRSSSRYLRELVYRLHLSGLQNPLVQTAFIGVDGRSGPADLIIQML